MPYLARTHQLKHSLLYHIYNRGLNRDTVFHKPQDYHCFIKLLSEYSLKYALKIYHWVIMPNHYHLLVELKDPETISSIMSGIARAYSCYHHREYKTTGYLWQGRFKSQPIERELYLSACGRYIERNPVKAKIVPYAWEYEYSSAKFYIFGQNDTVTTQNPLFEDFATTVKDRQQKYKEFLQAFNDEEDTCFENLESPQGSSEFLKRLFKENGHFFPRRQGRAQKN